MVAVVPWVGEDRWEEPECSLGWQIADWGEAYFTVPGGPMFGQPLVLSGWQLRALVDWYAVAAWARKAWRPGQPIPWLYRRALLRLAKKLGKSPFGGLIVAAEFCGPTVLDGFDAAGEPVGRGHDAPWIQVAAVSEDQTANTYRPFKVMMRGSSLPDELGIDVGEAKASFKSRPEALVEVVTAAAASRTGQPITHAVCDEVQLWHPGNRGTKLYRTMLDNAAPMGGRIMALCNAPEPGLRSVAESTEQVAAQSPDVMLYGPQYQEHVPDLQDEVALLEGLRRVYRDAPWTDPERIAKEIGDADREPEEVYRNFLNVPMAASSVLCQAPTFCDDELEVGAPVALGFDGSKTRDATALVAVHMVSGVGYLLGYWERPAGLPKQARWEVPRRRGVDVAGDVVTVDEVMSAAFERFRVALAMCDPSHWRDEVASWQQAWSDKLVRVFDVSSPSLVDRATEAMQDGLRQGSVRLSGLPSSAVLRAHVVRCRVARRMSGQRELRSLTKPEDGGRIDCAAAGTYANWARLEALGKGWTDQRSFVPIRVR